MRFETTGRAIAAAILIALAGLPAGAEPTATAVEPSVPAAETAAPTTAPSSLEKLNKVTEEQVEADKAALASQQRVNAFDDETQKMLAEYRRALADTESHNTYAAQLTRQVESQQEELASIQRQLDEVETTSRSISPLQQRMLATLKRFVELDLPFLLEERKARVATLEEMMDRADVSISEKYRRIVEAYQVEMDYGRTIEAYDGKLGTGSDSRTARFLRLGRVSLLYQTIDGRETGYWDANKQDWILDNRYSHSFKQGVAVAQKISAPEMILAPVLAPVEAKS